MDNVMSFRDKDNRYTDFRVLLREALDTGKATAKGIVVWVDDDGAVCLGYVGINKSNLSFAAVHLMKDVMED